MHLTELNVFLASTSTTIPTTTVPSESTVPDAGQATASKSSENVIDLDNSPNFIDLNQSTDATADDPLAAELRRRRLQKFDQTAN